MADLLLITDIPRLRQLFMRLGNDPTLRLRVANSLEQGGEEIATDKPAMVFVQAHVSGFSADILLKHLKRRLGRRRTRFVLLAPADQTSSSAIKLYHSYLDTSQSDYQLMEAFRDAIDSLGGKGKKRAATQKAEAPPLTDAAPPPTREPLPEEQTPLDRMDFQISPSAFSPEFVQTTSATPTEPAEPSLEEQGIAYPTRPLPQHTEFNSSLENAVSDMNYPEPPSQPTSEQPYAGADRLPDTAGDATPPSRPKYVSFLFWAVPVVTLVLIVTLLQQRASRPKPVDLAPKTASAPATETPTSTAQDNSVSTLPVAPRLTAPPPFIPRDGLDKVFGAANPGRERYMGRVTEFRLFREGASIKAIQVIDRGGRGIPESFMKGVLVQLGGKATFTPSSSDRRDGYEIRRGRVAANLSAVFYRDIKEGRLRAFVVTWQ